MRFVYHDGGRAAAGYVGEARDCVVRAIAIATGRPYADVYADLSKRTRERRAGGIKCGPRSGIPTTVVRKFFSELGWEWVPLMRVGSGCTTHLDASELPSGRFVVSLSKHVAAVIDGVVYDTHDPRRGGTRCVYGYWRPLDRRPASA